ncbi:hypothetical protein ACFP2F_08845 [Hymenobacter artigasi]|uniref:Uncharacterized protein n=1 Tax=Hymenobacter artigasi TaxID=2719616 RepID=A0ABX1HKQ9_9BACT|nr:hypothetical protein [Hymenobacter artigasi]NKI89363.1 hypothetical protein [Hymenobacter artigasi]
MRTLTIILAILFFAPTANAINILGFGKPSAYQKHVRSYMKNGRSMRRPAAH